MHAFLEFFCRLLGLSPAQYAAISGHKAARNLAMRAIAITVGSIAFGVAVFAFTRALLQYELLANLHQQTCSAAPLKNTS